MSELLIEEMKVKINRTKFYTHSKVVLGYINNESRRFHVYVNNRVQRIKQFSLLDQWRYVQIEHNPADHCSQTVPAEKLSGTSWLYGPAFLHNHKTLSSEKGSFELINLDSDVKIQHNVNVLVTTTAPGALGSSHFEKLSKWIC